MLPWDKAFDAFERVVLALVVAAGLTLLCIATIKSDSSSAVLILFNFCCNGFKAVTRLATLSESGSAG